MARLKQLRLQGLRRDLRDAAARSTMVLEMALRWGFWHLGRDYKLLFGETPAATLARKTRHSLQGASSCPPLPPPFESP
jgi:AraC family ethanolamine operon transcriptional activator